jgi:hypothetical protein
MVDQSLHGSLGDEYGQCECLSRQRRNGYKCKTFALPNSRCATFACFVRNWDSEQIEGREDIVFHERVDR